MKIRLTLVRNLALLAALTPALQACFPVVATGVGVTALVASDRRTSGMYLEDQGIELKGSNGITARYGDRVHTNLTSFNRNVLVTGEVPDAEAKAAIEKLVLDLPNVKGVVNELQVAGLSSLSSRGNDSYITSKVKARFIDAHKFSANHVKVTTEAGVVYLMGLVTNSEADDASDIARTTGGVMKVVRVFEYLTPEQARQIDNRPEPKANGK